MDGPADIRLAVHLDGHAGAASVAHCGPWGGLGGLGGLGGPSWPSTRPAERPRWPIMAPAYPAVAAQVGSRARSLVQHHPACRWGLAVGLGKQPWQERVGGLLNGAGDLVVDGVYVLALDMAAGDPDVTWHAQELLGEWQAGKVISYPCHLLSASCGRAGSCRSCCCCSPGAGSPRSSLRTPWRCPCGPSTVPWDR